MNKKQLRKIAKEDRKNIPQASRLREEELVTTKAMGLVKNSSAQNVCIYVSYRDELSTIALIEQLLSEKINVYVPKVSGKDMIFYRIASLKECAEGYMGISEPDVGEERRLSLSVNEGLLIFAPGLIFDCEGHRLGYGGGYYDRFVQKLNDEKVPYFYCGLGYCTQNWTESVIECEKGDVSVDALITSKGIVYY